jgi:hypothetical protein
MLQLQQWQTCLMRLYQWQGRCLYKAKKGPKIKQDLGHVSQQEDNDVDTCPYHICYLMYMCRTASPIITVHHISKRSSP